MVCSVPRSGSSLLCELLMSTGLAGTPVEFFHPSRMAGLMRQWGVEALDEYVRRLIVERTGPNGVFGMKVHWGQYRPNFGERDPRDAFPSLRFVSIRREDRLRQAISWVRALQSEEWRVRGSGKAEAPAVFDPDEIGRKLGRIESDEAAWKELFERYGITAREVTYEQLLGRREETLRDVVDHLGIELPNGFHFEPPKLERQADELSEEWVERYRAEAAGA